MLQSRAVKRTTLTWTDFSFWIHLHTRPIGYDIQFSTLLVNSISSWPEQQADITRKLKNTQESLPPFGWDTKPGIGTELVTEGASVGAFCDMMYSGGWMGIEREEIDGALVGAIVKGPPLPTS